VRNSPTLPEDVKTRLEALAGSRLTQDGVIVLFAQGSRSQEMNRQEARERLVELIRRATEKPKPRRPTKPTYSSKLKRLETKGKRAGVKALRGRPKRRRLRDRLVSDTSQAGQPMGDRAGRFLTALPGPEGRSTSCFHSGSVISPPRIFWR
jgi:hypothetical protein